MIKVLLLTGANNHDWKTSSPFLRQLLERSGRFDVTLTEAPSAALEDAASLGRYQLLFSDYNGPEWSPTAKANFAAAIRAGTGLAVMHAANNPFEGWVEFETMLALLWRKGSTHGEFREFTVAIRDREHPITKGLSDFRTSDELYDRLVPMHHAPHRVLATAYSDPARRGSGRDEPVLVVTQYGEGRVFHQILGHVWQGNLVAVENEGFQRTLLRGCEWAATGKVTLP